MATAAELLAEVETAISSLLTGGAASRGASGRSWQGLSLQDLFAERRRLKAEVNAGRSTVNYAELEDTQ